MNRETFNSRLIKTAMIGMISFVIVFNFYLIYNYILLNSSEPLDNFRGGFVTPISLSKDAAIVGEGMFDRAVTCQLTDFDIHLRNTNTTDEILIGPTSLLKAPPPNLKPGKDIPIEFVVAIPQTLYSGVWLPEFHGDYICRSGLFVKQTRSTLHLSALIVTP